MLNPNKKIAKSDGVDLPVMKVYLVGKISGNCMDKCLEWRKKIVHHFRNYRPVYDLYNGTKIVDYESYPIAFLCPLASGESKTADALGLTSHLPKNLIYDKDILSLQQADVIVAHLDDFMEEGIEDLMNIDEVPEDDTCYDNIDFRASFYRLQEKIKNRRANLGSHFEVSVALYLRKPVILIAGNERNKYILDNHPFFSRCSVCVLNTEQLLKEKWLQTFYKAMAGSTGAY